MIHVLGFLGALVVAAIVFEAIRKESRPERSVADEQRFRRYATAQRAQDEATYNFPFPQGK